jgi:hypothetical protein
LAVAALLALASVPAAAADQGPAPLALESGAGAGMAARIADLAAFGSRAEGSPGESAAFDYIERELRASGLEAASSGFPDAEGGYSSSRIVEASLKGAIADELAIIVPVSSWIDSPEPTEGAYGIALALDEAAALAAEARSGSTFPISLRFVFLGAEKRGKASEGASASLGSKTWVARQAGRGALAVCYLSLSAAPTGVSVRSAGAGALAPYWLYEGMRRALEPAGIAFDLEANRLQAYRLGLASDFGPAAPYLEAGLPAVELLGEAAKAGQAAKPGWFGAFLSGFAKAEKGGFADTWDKHFFILQLGKFGAVMRETTYVAILVAVLSIVAMSLLAATIARRNAAVRLLRRVPVLASQILGLFLVLSLVFLAGKGVAKLDGLALGSSGAWHLAPRAFAAARLASSLLLFLALLSILVERRVMTPNPYFYEFAALFCLAADALIFSVTDLSASFYFIWALLLVEASLALRRRWATIAAYVLMSAPPLVMAAELAARPDLDSYRRLIAPNLVGILSMSAVALPFFAFTASPLLFLARPGAAARKRAALLFASLAVAIEAFALVWAGFSDPPSGPLRRDLSASELIDQDSGEFTLELSGLRRLGKGSVYRGGAKLDYDTDGDRAVLKGEDRAARISVSEKSSPFLDRVDEAVTIGFDTAPYEVDLALESSGDILIYDCNLPYKVAEDGKSAAIYAGANPGRSILLSLTVTSSFRSRLVVTARYLSPLVPASQSSGSALADRGHAVKASFEIGAGLP